jgi:hypothetical protein
MPIRKFSLKKVIYKLLDKKNYNTMLYTLATPETPGFKWLHFFQPEYWPQISNILKKGPTVFEVVSLAVQNSDKLANIKVKLTRMDEFLTFDVEIQDDDNWETQTLDNGWFSIKHALFFIGELENGFSHYRFI